MHKVTHQLAIREDELRFTASRSSGPGGQNVNKVNTRVTLWFDVGNSQSLSAEQKKRILTRLSTRVSKKKILRVVSQKHRSQAANREAALERFIELLRKALKGDKPRERTRVPAAARRRRLYEKRRRSLKRRERSQRFSWES